MNDQSSISNSICSDIHDEETYKKIYNENDNLINNISDDDNLFTNLLQLINKLNLAHKTMILLKF